MTAPVVIIITRPPRSADPGDVPAEVETSYGPDKGDLMKARDDLDELIASLP
jgi:hypothetical protein